METESGYMCVCVRERERVKERGGLTDRRIEAEIDRQTKRWRQKVGICVCVCVCERERERERGGD